MRRLLPDLFHVAEAPDWEAAVDVGAYDRSTRGAALEDVGFIHTSFVWQVEKVANFLYPDETVPLVLLRIDPALIDVPVKVEPVGTDVFPHLYGPLRTSAVVEVLELPRSSDGYRLPPELAY